MFWYSDRARALCDPQYLEAELQNIEEVFIENGYSKKEVQEAMTKKRAERNETEEQVIRGIVSVPNIPNFTRTFGRIAKQHNFRIASKAEKKVKDLASKARTALGEKNMNVVYNIPCGCGGYSYTGETDRKWKTRKREHMDKVRLTETDITNGRTERATERMNSGDGGLAKHNVMCTQEVNWEESRIVGKERGAAQRKFLEGIETIKERSKGRIPLNAYNQMEPWQPTIFAFTRN